MDMTVDEYLSFVYELKKADADKDIHIKQIHMEEDAGKLVHAGKASYVVRNKEMIDKSNFCIFYYDENYLPPRRGKSNDALIHYQPKSGTAIAYEYAIKYKIIIINMRR